MAAPRRVIELAVTESDLVELMRLARSRTEPASRVERARMLLAYRDTPSFYAVGRAIGVHIKPSNDAYGGPGSHHRLTTVRVRDVSGLSRKKRELSLSVLPAANQRASAIHTNCGRLGC
jgi:hypothetical protein